MAVAQQGAQPAQPLSICGLQLECHPTERDWNLRHADALVRANQFCVGLEGLRVYALSARAEIQNQYFTFI